MDDINFSLFKLSRSGNWYIQFTDANGIRKQKSTRCARRADAYKKLSDFKKFIETNSKKNNTILSVFFADYLKHIEAAHSPCTLKSYGLSLRHFLRITGDIPIASITPRHWDAYKTVRLKEKKTTQRKCGSSEELIITQQSQGKVAATTINIELRSLRAAMSTAARWELISKNPFEKLPLVSVPRKAPAFLTVPDAERLLAAIKEPWFRDIVIFAINTGMRRGELLALRWQDINFDMRIARITNRADFTTKSGEERIVSLNDAALAVLSRRRLASKIDTVFTDDKGNPAKWDSVSHKFKRVIRRAGLPEALHLHSLRHSFASLLVGSGTSLFTVSKLLGHSTTKTSEIYSHLLPHHMQKEVDKITIGNN
jgi:integrase